MEVTVAVPAQSPEGVAGLVIRYFGDYEIQQELARGGMGVVYKARQVSLNRPVAVKMLLAGTLADAAAVARFHTEAEAAANLRHPNIVAIHEIGEHDGQHYFSMDYVDGRNLAEVVGGRPLPVGTAATCVRTVAEATHFAHQRGTLHRDLKPSNILIDDAGRPHITDFGLAKIASRDDRLTTTGAVLGTASYMSPEQAAGRHDRVGPSSDVYSLGAILYELLTGRPPFLADSVQATLVKAATEEAVSTRTRNVSVPVDLDTICLKCLEKSPERRYATARELAEDLGRFLSGEPIHARPVSRARRIQQWLKRRPWMLAGAVAALLLVLATLSYGLWQQNRYLVWRWENVEATTTPAARTAYLERLRGITLPVRAALMLLLVVGSAKLSAMTKNYERLGYGSMRFLGWEDRSVVSPPPPAATTDPRMLRSFEVAGAAGIGFALFMLKASIDAWVWEGYLRTWQSFEMVVLTFIGSGVIANARHLRRVQISGGGERGLSP